MGDARGRAGAGALRQSDPRALMGVRAGARMLRPVVVAGGQHAARLGDGCGDSAVVAPDGGGHNCRSGTEQRARRASPGLRMSLPAGRPSSHRSRRRGPSHRRLRSPCLLSLLLLRSTLPGPSSRVLRQPTNPWDRFGTWVGLEGAHVGAGYPALAKCLAPSGATWIVIALAIAGCLACAACSLRRH